MTRKNIQNCDPGLMPPLGKSAPREVKSDISCSSCGFDYDDSSCGQKSQDFQ